MKRALFSLLFLVLALPANAATMLKQSTATTITLGPFVDEDDGKTAETGLTLTSATLKLSKNGAAFAVKGQADTAGHDTGGWYRVALSTADTGTLGPLTLMCHESGALPCWREFLVVPANSYDSFVSGSDYLDAQVRGADANVLTASALATDAVTEMWEATTRTLTAGTNLSYSTHSAADVWAATTRTLTAGTNLNDLSAAAVNAEVDAALADYGGSTLSTTTIAQAIWSEWTTRTVTSTGVGTETTTYTLTASGVPVADADVWVTTDAIGSNVIASGQTDQYGKVVFYLDSGQVYMWRQKSGVNFTNPDVETIP